MEYNTYKKTFGAPFGSVEEGFKEDREPWHIAAYDGNYIAKTGHFLPISMSILLCTADKQPIDFATLIYPKPSLNEEIESYDDRFINYDSEFCGDYINILHGRNPDWFLARFSPVMTGIRLDFCHKERQCVEKLYLNIVQTRREVRLNLQFSVPHASGKPNTGYTFRSHAWYFTPDAEAPSTEIQLNFANEYCYGVMDFCTNNLYETGRHKEILEYAVIDPDYAMVEECIDV